MKNKDGKWWVLNNDRPEHLELEFVEGDGWDYADHMWHSDTRKDFFRWSYTKEELVAYYQDIYINEYNKLMNKVVEISEKINKLYE